MALSEADNWKAVEAMRDYRVTDPEGVRPLSLPDLIVMAEHTADDIEMMAEDLSIHRHETMATTGAVELFAIGADLMMAWAKVSEARVALQAYQAVTHG